MQEPFLVRSPGIAEARKGGKVQPVDVGLPFFYDRRMSDSAPSSDSGVSTPSSSSDKPRRSSLRSVSFKGSIEGSDKHGSQGSWSTSASVESLRSEYAEALSHTKGINAQILQAQK